MAIYHLQAKVIQRSAGRSVIAAAAYRAAAALYDAETGRTENYLAKLGVVHSEILLPAGAPAGWHDRELLWNTVVAGERRRDAVLAREIELALPRELSQAEAIALVRDYVAEQFMARGMVADLNVHWGHSADGEAQPHAHVLLTMRRVADGSFGLKERGWNDKALLRDWRQRWAELANERLASAGHDVRIDHRTLAAQGIDLAPQNKIGPVGARRAARSEDAERAAEHRAIARGNGAWLLADPGLALRTLMQQQSTFTRADLARLVHRQSDGAEQFAAVMAAVEAHPERVRVGRDGRGVERFSTREMVALEATMVADAAALTQRTSHAVPLERRRAAVAGATLGAEQELAFQHVTRSRDLVAVVGYAGTGKSTLLGVAREAWEGSGYRVRGAALSGIAAEGLATGSGIADSRTVHSLLWAWERGRDRLAATDVLVVDEAGMIGSRQLAALLREVRAAGAKAVLVGDPEQLQAIEAGAAFRAIVERVGAAEITTVVRQRTEWQQTATQELATGRTAEALERYRAAGLVREHATREAALTAVVAGWDAVRRGRPEASQIMLAHTRAAVTELNERARAKLREAGALGEERVVTTERGARAFAAGDRLYFLKNDRELGVRNGTLGTVVAIGGEDAKALRLTVRLDGGEGRRVTFAPSEYGWIEHGYAATVHKAQGVTVAQAHVLASPGMDRHLAYVALSRHRDGVAVHWSGEEFGGGGATRLAAALGRERAKDTTLDYGEATPEWAYAERRGLHPLAPASEIVVRAPATAAAPLSVLVPNTCAVDAAALHAGVAVLAAAGRLLRDAMARDLVGARRQARERLDGGQLRQALRAALHGLARSLRQPAAWTTAPSEAAAAVPPAVVASPKGSGRFAGLTLKLPPPASPRVASTAVAPPQVQQQHQQLRALANAWAAAEKMRAMGLPTLAHHDHALKLARQALDPAIADRAEKALAGQPQLAARIDQPDGMSALIRGMAVLHQVEVAQAEARQAADLAREEEFQRTRARLLEERLAGWVEKHLGTGLLPPPGPGRDGADYVKLYQRREAGRVELRQAIAKLPETELLKAAARWASDAEFIAWRNARHAGPSSRPSFGPGM